ncbi:MAG: hypothetical protein L3J43_07455 [Sulfurovum sp.]|nr:hypothetical protein [Sulfurovum sp.]
MRFITSLFKNLNKQNQSDEKNDTNTIKVYSTEEIATYFNISKKSVEEILIEVQWIKDDKSLTKEGRKYAAILKDKNNIFWQNSILSNELFINKINSKINTLIFALSQNFKAQKNMPSEYAYIA